MTGGYSEMLKSTLLICPRKVREHAHVRYDISRTDGPGRVVANADSLLTPYGLLDIVFDVGREQANPHGVGYRCRNLFCDVVHNRDQSPQPVFIVGKIITFVSIPESAGVRVAGIIG